VIRSSDFKQVKVYVNGVVVDTLCQKLVGLSARLWLAELQIWQ